MDFGMNIEFGFEELVCVGVFKNINLQRSQLFWFIHYQHLFSSETLEESLKTSVKF